MFPYTGSIIEIGAFLNYDYFIIVSLDFLKIIQQIASFMNVEGKTPHYNVL